MGEWHTHSACSLHSFTDLSIHMLDLDRTLFTALNRGAANPFLDWLMPRITSLHQQAWFLVCAALAVLFLLWRGDRRIRVWLLTAFIAVGLSDLTAYRIVKYVW